MMTTEDLRNELLRIASDLREGKITTTVARALIQDYKAVLDSLKIEMNAATLGSGFSAVEMDAAKRVSKLSRAA